MTTPGRRWTAASYFFIHYSFAASVLASSPTTTPAPLLRQPSLRPPLLVYSYMARNLYWSRPTHAWCWQHRCMASSPTRPRAWQAWTGASSSSASTTSSLDRVTDEFFYAYSVLAKPEYAFVPDVRLVLAKLGLHLVLDGSDCIDFGIDNLHDCLDASPSLSSHTTSHAATSTPAPDHDIDHGDPSRGSLDQGCSTLALGSLDIGTKGYHLACASPASSTVQASATPLRP